METDIILSSIGIYLLLITAIALLLFSVCMIAIPKTPTIDKIAKYECGFSPYENIKYSFNIHFYIVGLLFILFDIEVTFLFPIVFILPEVNLLSIIIIHLFIILLFLGIFYEWLLGVLDWE